MDSVLILRGIGRSEFLYNRNHSISQGGRIGQRSRTPLVVRYAATSRNWGIVRPILVNPNAYPYVAKNGGRQDCKRVFRLRTSYVCVIFYLLFLGGGGNPSTGPPTPIVNRSFDVLYATFSADRR